jgi:hypothetical protein
MLPLRVCSVLKSAHMRMCDMDGNTLLCRLQNLQRLVHPSTLTDGSQASGNGEHVPLHPKAPSLRLRTYPFMLFPLATTKIFWDYLIIGMVAFNVVELPYSITFSYHACQVCTFDAPAAARYMELLRHFTTKDHKLALSMCARPPPPFLPNKHSPSSRDMQVGGVEAGLRSSLLSWLQRLHEQCVVTRAGHEQHRRPVRQLAGLVRP